VPPDGVLIPLDFHRDGFGLEGRFGCEQVQDLLAYFRPAEVLGISEHGPEAKLGVPTEGEFTLVDIATGHEQRRVMLSPRSLEKEDGI